MQDKNVHAELNLQKKNLKAKSIKIKVPGLIQIHAYVCIVPGAGLIIHF